MRAGPLSDLQTIQLLNSYFVPVYVSSEDYGRNSAKSPAEVEAYRGIRKEASEEGRHDGTVCVYLVSPDGDCFDSLTVGKATDIPRLRQMLQAAIAKFQVTPGETLVAPTPQNKAPEPPEGGILVYSVSRGSVNAVSAGWIPGEDWIPLEGTEWRSLLPSDDAKVGDTWAIDRAIAEKLLTHMHPPTRLFRFEDHREPEGPHGHRIEKMSLEGKVLARQGSVLRIRYDGHVQIKRTDRAFRPDENRAVSGVVGFAEFDLSNREFRSLQLISSEGQYDGVDFRVAMKLVDSN